MQKQIIDYMNQYLSPLLCGYRKGFSTQTALPYLIEKWKFMLDKKGYAVTILMNLSKVFDTSSHELLVAKLNAYGSGKEALKLVFSYFNNRKQRVKITERTIMWYTTSICVGANYF